MKKLNWKDFKIILRNFFIMDIPFILILIFVSNYISKLEIEKTKNIIKSLMLIGISILIFIIVAIYYYFKKDKQEFTLAKRIAENTYDALIITDSDTKITYVNNAFEQATGYKKEEVIGLKPSNFKSNRQSPEFYKMMWKSINEKGNWKGELWDKKKNGMLYPKKLNILAVSNKYNKKATQYIGIFTDLSKLKKEEENVQRLKNYNIRTNLPNENLFLRLIDDSIQGNEDKFSIIYFSIENYKSLMLKTEEDDQFIIPTLIERIKNIINEKDFIAHVSKRKFVIGLFSITNTKKEALEDFIRYFFEENKKPICFKDTELFLDIKAGISIYPQDGSTSKELIVNASIALEQALDSKENFYVHYKPVFKDNINKEVEMNFLLRKAILNNELEVYYQPQIEIKSDKIVGAEALIRWDSSKLGQVSPSVFIPLAEKTGQIFEIGDWLIDRIFKDYLSIEQKLKTDFRLSINISPLQFNDKAFLPKFIKLINKYNVDPNKLEIEITEGVLMYDVRIINNYLNEFKNLGITVAIDDFGTGYSSLRYLKDLHIDKLKIDRSFIKDYPESDNGRMAEVITNMANKLNLKVIAEGAETIKQVNYLQSIGCPLIQGFYYSRPLPRYDFEKYLENNLNRF